MDLLEFDGKRLLAHHGVQIPLGGLWPDRPKTDTKLVVKAQVPAGGRGKQGGIRFADSWEEAGNIAESLIGSCLGSHHVKHVYIEEKLAIERELYLSVFVDRDKGCLSFLASPEGGVDIEEVARQRILRLPVDPLLGLQHFQARAVARFLDPDGSRTEALTATATRLYHLLLDEDATMVEINPLVITKSDAVVAADCKISLDDNAQARHRDREDFRTPDTRSGFERRIAETGAVGVEINPEGEVLAVISGAGLMMATLDLLAGAGLRVRGVIDLGGTVLAGGDELARVFAAAVETGAEVVFLNAFMQTALCDEFARRLIAAHERVPLQGRVVVRLKGRRSGEGRRLLADHGFEIHEDLRPAIHALIGREG